MRALVSILMCCAVSAACFGQAPDKREWGEKFNSSGAQLKFKELDRTRINGQTAVTYHMFGSGLPVKAEYTLSTWILGGEPEEQADAYINKDGLVVNVLADPVHKIAEDPIDLIVFAGRGEPKRFALISTDGRYRAFGQIVPFPIEATAGPCHMSAVTQAANYTAVLVVVEGLQPGEELQIDGQSAGEGGRAKAQATGQGKYVNVLFPQVTGKRSGTTRFSVTAKSCQIGVEFPWGESSYSIQ
jgi:hypothetical protein